MFLQTDGAVHSTTCTNNVGTEISIPNVSRQYQSYFLSHPEDQDGTDDTDDLRCLLTIPRCLPEIPHMHISAEPISFSQSGYNPSWHKKIPERVYTKSRTVSTKKVSISLPLSPSDYLRQFVNARKAFITGKFAQYSNLQTSLQDVDLFPFYWLTLNYHLLKFPRHSSTDCPSLNS